MIARIEPHVSRDQSDDVRWFTEQIEPHRGTLKAYLRGKFPRMRDLDDVVQESLVRVWRAKAGAPIRSGKAFLFSIARRLAIDLARKEQRSPLVDVEDMDQLFVPAPHGGSVADLARTEHVDLLVEAIDTLPARCREIFILCQVEKHSQRDVAARLGIAESTVGVQSARGLQRCETYIRRKLSQR